MNLLILVLLIGALPSGDSWPAFRGTGDGISQATKLPTEWTETKNLAWKIDLPGYGQSNPVIWNNTVYVTSVEGENREKGYIVAYSMNKGNELWRHEFEPTQKAKWGYTISRAAPTPCVDATGVYAFFEGGNVISLDHTGKKRWERSLVKEYGELKGGHGVGSSPAQSEDALFILIDHGGPSYLIAIDKRSGETRWKADRASKSSWTSPVMTSKEGKQILIVSSNGSVTGYDPKDGKEVYKLENFVGNTIPSATVVGDRILVGAGINRSKDAATKETKSNCLLKLSQHDGKPTLNVEWTAKAGLASYATPLAYRGVGYFINEVGVLVGLDLENGKELFSERIAGPSWASPIAAGDHIYFFGKNGISTVIKSGKVLEIVSTNPLWKSENKPKAEKKTEGRQPSGDYDDPIFYGAAAGGNSLILRSGSNLFCIRN
jgi:outer membrane protein assembly factor BamB